MNDSTAGDVDHSSDDDVDADTHDDHADVENGVDHAVAATCTSSCTVLVPVALLVKAIWRYDRSPSQQLLAASEH